MYSPERCEGLYLNQLRITSTILDEYGEWVELLVIVKAFKLLKRAPPLNKEETMDLVHLFEKQGKIVFSEDRRQ